MSVRSMTGYGRGMANAHGLRVEVEVSSVNRKQLDIQLTLPQALKLLESRIQDAVSQRVSRGRVLAEFAVHESDKAKREAIRVNEDMAAAYVKGLRKTAAKLGLRDDLGASLLVKLPGVLHYETLDEDVEKIWPILSAALKKALDDLLRMRTREGANLLKELTLHLDRLVRQLGAIKKYAPGVTARYREALRARLEKAGLDTNVDQERLERELILFADKSDITEETARLESHIGQARGLLKSGEPSGRALDFLAQEMFREINTIGSKANDASIAGHVVSFKADLERWREQVQNIE
jgi:uncharacterized protein (TIGR00255 family)